MKPRRFQNDDLKKYLFKQLAGFWALLLVIFFDSLANGLFQHLFLRLNMFSAGKREIHAYFFMVSGETFTGVDN